VQAILEAAEEVLSEDPGASMEQIGEAAGLARTTVHRRFANRQALMDALAVSAKQQLADAIEAGSPDTAPPLVALHTVTAGVLRTKSAWKFTLGNSLADTSAAASTWEDINNKCLDLLGRAQREGLLDPSVDLKWTRQVYYALISEALQRHNTDPHAAAADPDSLAALVVETLLHGAGRRT
jgi:AcrR family transcriptional regulator